MERIPEPPDFARGTRRPRSDENLPIQLPIALAQPPPSEERAACPRCGRLLAFPVTCERLACDNSLGWTARILNIGRDHPEKTAAHMVAEVWSDEWQKWAVVDPLYAGWFSARGKGKGPLSFLEVHGDWVRHGGRNVVLHHRVRSSSANLIGPERTLPALKDDTKHRHLHPSTYFWGIACLSNRFLTEPYEEGRFLALLWRDRWNQGRPWLNRNQAVGYSRARHLVETDSPLDFHPPLNNTAIWIHRDPDRPRIFLRTSCPNFSHFEMKAGASWRRVPADFTFPSARGDFAWAFRAVNRFGVAGSASLLRGGVARNR